MPFAAAAATTTTASDSTLTSVLSTLQTIYTFYIFPNLPAPLQTISAHLTSLFPDLNKLNLANLDVVSLAACLVILYISLRILDYVRRSVIAWVMFFIKLGVVLLIIQLVFYVQAYGLQKTIHDAGWIGGMVWGYVEGVINENGTGGGRSHGSGSGSAAGKWNAAPGAGGRQQVPIGKSGTRRNGGWT